VLCVEERNVLPDNIHLLAGPPVSSNNYILSSVVLSRSSDHYKITQSVIKKYKLAKLMPAALKNIMDLHLWSRLDDIQLAILDHTFDILC
jgi:hypothetical protein